MSFQLSSKVDKDKVFLMNSSELEERLDPLFYVAVRNIKNNISRKAKYPCSELIKNCSIHRGKFGHRPRNDPKFYTGKYPFIQTGDIVKVSSNNSTIEYTQTLNEKGLKTSKLFNPPKLLFTIAANIADTAILTYPSCFPDSIVAIEPKDNNLSLNYLNIYLRLVKPYIVELAPYSAQKNLNNQQLAQVPVIIPPKNIQAQVVSEMESAYASKKQREVEAQQLLDSIDDYLLDELGIKLPKTNNTINNRVFKISSKKIINGRLDPYFHKKEFKEIEKNIANSQWNVVALEDIFFINRGGSPRPINDYFTDAEDGLNWIKIGDTKGVNKYITRTKQKIKPEGAKYSRKVVKGDFILSNSMSFGRPYIMGISGYIHDGWLSFKPKSDNINNDFIHSILGSTLLYQLFKKSTIGGVVDNLNIALVKKIRIPLPPLEKQLEISSHISEIYEKSQQLQQQAKSELEQAKKQVEAMILGEA